jgi:amino acid adenylation domain-containing protein
MSNPAERSEPHCYGSLTAVECALTPLQEAMLYLRLSRDQVGANILQVLLRVDEALQAHEVERSVQHMVSLHDALRTSFDWQSRAEPFQRILPGAVVPVRWLDISHASDAESRIRDYLTQDRAAEFDPGLAPLARITVFALPGNRCALLWTFHHLIVDRRSLGIVLIDFLSALREIRAGRQPPADRLPLAARPSAASRSPRLGPDAQAYYRKLFSGVTEPTSLDVGFVSREGARLDVRQIDRRMTRAETDALRETARRFQCEPHVVFEAAFALLVHRYSGRPDALFGVVRDGRPADVPGCGGMVGMFIGTPPRRSQLTDSITVSQYVQALATRDRAQRPFDHCSLAEIQALSGIPHGSPLFEALVSLEHSSLESELAAHYPCGVEYLWQTNVPLTLVGQLDAEASLRLGFDPSRYDAATAERMLGHFARLLNALCTASPGTPVSKLPMLSESERHLLIDGWNQTQGPYPDELRIHDLFESQARQHPDQIAVVCGAESISYRLLEERANRLANALRARGAACGSRIGICLPRSSDMVVAMLAVLKTGAAYVPLDPSYPADRLRFMLRDAGAGLVISVEPAAGPLDGHACELILLDRDAGWITAQPAVRPVCDSSPDDIGYVIYTSGSTGQPKGVMVRHRRAVNLIDWVNGAFNIGPRDRLLFVTSICFDLSVYDVFGVLGAGASLHIATSAELREPRGLVDLVDGGSITLWDSAPAALAQLVPFFPKGSRSSALRHVMLSGDWIPVPLPDQVRTAFPKAQVVSLGGATEATIWSNFYLVDEVPKHWPSIPYGRPIRNARYYVLSDQLEPVPVGVPGQLHIGGDCLADGYLHRPELTAEKFIDDPFSPSGQGKMYRTGDIARFMPDGNIEFLGRIDHQVKIRGFRIELGEIEAVLNQHPRVASALVDAQTLSSDDGILVAYFVPAGGKPDAADLRALCQQKLPAYMVPAYFMALDRLPVSINGKVDRRALPAPERSANTVHIEPRDALEVGIARIFEETLGVSRVGVHDDFFELGGHSLVAVRLVCELSRVFGHEIPLSSFLAKPTVETVAEMLREHPVGASQIVDRIERDPRAPPVVSPEQSRLAFVQGLYPSSATYNISMGFELTGEVDADRLSESIDLVVERHEPLRTGLYVSSGGYDAVIHESVHVPLQRADLSNLPPAGQAAAIDAEARRLNGVAFDLSRPPLMRAVLARLGATRHVLILVVHHVAFDGPSREILVRELICAYDALAAGEPVPLAASPIRFNDVARWQLRRLARHDYARDLEYWRKRLAGPLPVLQLPHDKPRPRVFSHRGGIQTWTLPRAQSTALRDTARRHRSSVFTLLLAAFHALLHRYSGQSDILVAIPIAARDHPESRDLIGLLLNTLVIRSEFAPSMSFGELLGQVRSRFLEALDHRELPFERLVADLNPPRDPSITPVFQAFFSYEETSGRISGGKHFKVSNLVVDQVFAGTEISLFVEDGADEELRGYFEYSSDLFEAESISRMTDGFVELLGHISQAADADVDLLRVMTPEERLRQLYAWNQTRTNEAAERTIIELFEERVVRAPHRTAVHSDRRALTYGALHAEMLALSSVLTQNGAGPGVGVAVYLERGPHLLVGLLAVLHAGAYYIPLDPSHPQERTRRILAIAAPNLALVEERTRDTLPELGGTLLLDVSVPCARSAARASPRGPALDDMAYVIFTSGSTGEPKGVEISHRSLGNFLVAMARTPGMREDDRLLALTTIAFDIAGLELYLPLVTGGCVEIAERDLATNPDGLARSLREDAVTVFQATPATFRMLLDNGWSGQSNLKALCGGEALSHELARTLAPRVESLWNMYGPTETTIWSSVERIGSDSESVSIGRPIDNTEMYVLNDRLEPVPQGAVGMLWIGGDGVALGYHRRPELTAAAFVPDPFTNRPGARIYRTGDLARRLADGRLECLGRDDFQVKVRGYRIELGEIESALVTHPDVKEAVVQVNADDGGEKRLVAYVVRRDASDEVPADLAQHLKARLPGYMVPGTFLMLSALPLTANGKIDRKALPEPRPEAVQSGHDLLPPRDDIEVKLAEIFERLLGRDGVGADQNFFDIGGHSLLAARVMREVNQAFGLALGIGAIFEHPSVAGLAAVVRRGGGRLGSQVIPLNRGRNGVPIYFVCGIHLYRGLAKALEPRFPCFGVYVPLEEQYMRPGTTLTDLTISGLAEAYAAAIRAHAQAGPCVLAGFSFGGLLAFEVVRQLRASGCEVPQLILLDAVLPAAVRRRPARWLRFALKKAWRRLAMNPVRLPVRWTNPIEARSRDREEARDAHLWELLRGPLTESYFAQHPCHDGPALIVQAERRDGFEGYEFEHGLGWRRFLTGTVAIASAPGDHLDILTAHTTAQLMLERLDDLDAAYQATRSSTASSQRRGYAGSRT